VSSVAAIQMTVNQDEQAVSLFYYARYFTSLRRDNKERSRSRRCGKRGKLRLAHLALASAISSCGYD
jgi:ligand-binding sensor protein